MKKEFLIASLLLLWFSAEGKMVTKEYTYKLDTMTFKGFLAYDDAIKGKRPGVLVVHEWWGLNDFAKTQAKRLAEMGYVALAADMYGNGTNTADPKTAGAMAGSLRGTPRLRESALAGLSALLCQADVDSHRVAAIGFCFGGSAVLDLAYGGAKVNGVVTFHGGLFSPKEQDIKNIKTKILVLHGADDPTMPRDTVLAFQDAMRKSVADWQMVYYANAVHGFTNPANGTDNSRGVAYNPLAAQRSWEQMKLFLNEVLAKKQ
jgi:dienelactone hydrolase